MIGRAHSPSSPTNRAKCQARRQKSERMKADEGRPQGRPFDVAVPPGTARGGAFSGALHDRNRPQAVRYNRKAGGAWAEIPHPAPA